MATFTNFVLITFLIYSCANFLEAVAGFKHQSLPDSHLTGGFKRPPGQKGGKGSAAAAAGGGAANDDGVLHLLVDMDPGIDDAWALILLLKAHQDPAAKVKIEAITCNFGNTKMEHVLQNLWRVLRSMNETEIPVYRGAESAFAVQFVENPPYFGEDGFGDRHLLLDFEPHFEEEHAVLAINRLARKFSGALSVLALAPLTNLALTISMFPDISKYFKELVILGGNIDGIGNSLPFAEFNFLKDAEAAKAVLEKYTCPMSIIPLETFVDFGSTSNEFRMETIGSIGTPQILLMNQVETHRLENKSAEWGPADVVAAAVILEPQVVTKSKMYFCTVELAGSLTRGMMACDKLGHDKKKPNARVITEINTPFYKEMLVKAASAGLK